MQNDTIFIIGSGPSLNKIDMSLLKNQDTFSMNRQYIAYGDWGFYPTYYAMIDRRLIATIFEKEVIPQFIKKEECKIKKYFIVSHTLQDYNDGKDIATESLIKDDKVIYIGPFSSYTPRDLREMSEFGQSLGDDRPIIHSHCYGNCGIFATALACLMGYKKVVLLGMDLKYANRDASIAAGQDLSHFHPKYFDVTEFTENETHGTHKGSSRERSAHTDESVWKETLDMTIGGIEILTGQFTEIISSTPESPINNIFPYVPFEDMI